MKDDPLYKKIRVHAEFACTSEISIVEVAVKPEQIGSFDNDELVALALKPLRFVTLIEFKLSTKANWRSCSHVTQFDVGAFQKSNKFVCALWILTALSLLFFIFYSHG